MNQIALGAQVRGLDTDTNFLMPPKGTTWNIHRQSDLRRRFRVHLSAMVRALALTATWIFLANAGSNILVSLWKTCAAGIGAG